MIKSLALLTQHLAGELRCRYKRKVTGSGKALAPELRVPCSSESGTDVQHRCLMSTCMYKYLLPVLQEWDTLLVGEPRRIIRAAGHLSPSRNVWAIVCTCQLGNSHVGDGSTRVFG
jgi:hypothetical protein